MVNLTSDQPALKWYSPHQYRQMQLFTNHLIRAEEYWLYSLDLAPGGCSLHNITFLLRSFLYCLK